VTNTVVSYYQLAVCSSH